MSAPDLTHDLVRSTTGYVDSWWAFRRRHHRVPGVQGAVGLDGQVLLSTAHGLADVEAATTLTTEHVFRVASHSKTFTATVVHQLAAEGVLRLDDRLDAWLPWTADASAGVGAVTLRQLLNHSAGLVRDGLDGDQWQLRRPFHDEADLREVVRDAVVTGPDVAFKYSNIGYALLGLVVASATGTTWAQAVHERVVDRLGLTSTAADLAPGDPLADRVATGYTSLAYADARVPVDQVGTRAMAAATGFCSTASDLLRYVAAHRDGDGDADDPRLLDPQARRQLQHGWWDVPGAPGDAYGLGMGVSTVGERRLVGHGGGWPGHITRTLLDPGSGLAVSVLTNAIDGPALELAVGAVKLVDLAATPGRHALTPPQKDLAHAFVGRWATLWGVQDIALLGDRLVGLNPSLADPTAAVVDLEVVDADTLVMAAGPGYGAVGEQVRATRDGAGRVATLRTASGMTTWRADELPLPRRVTPGSI
ncbi:serine hydrolase domain-containing protein [Aquipuribacter sp. MA13-6]|uniref:serine hydrolase domain-containing protein n=1 Tax=unclassified Aquipuribacter TaxID=2635084 RepID=UPI003EED79DC